MLYRLMLKIAGPWSATVACVAFTVLLATGQPGPAPNYNFVTPYSHEINWILLWL